MASDEAFNWRAGLSLVQRLQYMMEGQYRWDVSLRTDEEDQPVIRAHQLILVAGSPYFEDRLNVRQVQKEEPLHLTDTKHSVLEKVVRFLYYEDIQLTSRCVIDVMKAAMKFQIPQLITRCSQYMMAEVNVTSVCEFMTFSVEIDDAKLRDVCVKFISEDANSVFTSAAFLRISQTALVWVLKSDYLQGMSEVDVFKACIKWSDRACQNKELDLNDKNRREVLGKAFFQIRFSALTVDEFTELTEGSSLLNCQEENMIFRSIARGSPLPYASEFNRRARTTSPRGRNSGNNVAGNEGGILTSKITYRRIDSGNDTAYDNHDDEDVRKREEAKWRPQDEASTRSHRIVSAKSMEYVQNRSELRSDSKTQSYTANIVASGKWCSRSEFLEKLLETSFGIAKLLDTALKSRIQSICQNYGTAIAVVLNPKKPGALIKGNSAGHEIATKLVKKVIDSVKTNTYTVSKPGMAKYFYSRLGTVFLDTLEKQYSVAIEIVDDNQEDNTDVDASYMVELSKDRKIVAMQGDMTKFTGGAIVNAANESLNHGGGLARAIVIAGGKEIQDESSKFVKEHGKVPPGHVCTTGAGRLPCNYVIHAVGPLWCGGNSNEEQVLTNAVLKALAAGDENGVLRIAIPAISTGVLRFPLDTATRTIVQAVETYFKRNTHSGLREVILIDMLADTVKSFHVSLCDVYGRDTVKRRSRLAASFQFPSGSDQRQPTYRSNETGYASNEPTKEGIIHRKQISTSTTLVLQVFGEEMEHVEHAILDIDRECRRQFVVHVLSSRRDQDAIARLTESQIRKIKSFEQTNVVKITIKRHNSKPFITIEGQTNDANNVLKEVTNMLRDVKNPMPQKSNKKSRS